MPADSHRSGPRLDVLVDAENVRRSRWPNVRRDRLVELVSRWAGERGHRAVIVFDGQAPGGLVGERALEDGTQLVGTGRGSADDWLAGAAESRRASARPYILVTSDRNLRERAASGAEDVIGGGAFLRELDPEATAQ